MKTTIKQQTSRLRPLSVRAETDPDDPAKEAAPVPEFAPAANPESSMNPIPSSPTPTVQAPGEKPKRLSFEWTKLEPDGTENEYGDPQVTDVTREYWAEILEPGPGKVVEGLVLFFRHPHEDGLYAVIGTDMDARDLVGTGSFCEASDLSDTFVAIRTDVAAYADPDQSYKMRSVVLDEPNRPFAWEVLKWNPDQDLWQPVKGQFLRPRTILAEQWLAETSPVLADLSERERRLLDERRALTSPSRIGRLRDVKVLALEAPESQVLANGLNDIARLAPGSTRTAQGSEPRRSLIGSWFSSPEGYRWNRLRPLVKWLDDVLCYLKLRFLSANQGPVSDRPAGCVNQLKAPQVRGPVRPGAKARSNPVVVALDQQLISVRRDLQQGDDLVRYLEAHPGSPVTLLQTAIEGRRAEMLPTRPPGLRTAPRTNARYRMHL